MAQYGEREGSRPGCRSGDPRFGRATVLRLLISSGIVVAAWFLLGGSSAAAAETERTAPQEEELGLLSFAGLSDAFDLDAAGSFLGAIEDSDITGSVTDAADDLTRHVPEVAQTAGELNGVDLAHTTEVVFDGVIRPVVRTVGERGGAATDDAPVSPASSPAKAEGFAPTDQGSHQLRQVTGGNAEHSAAESDGKGGEGAPIPDSPGSPVLPAAVTTWAGSHSSDGSGGPGSGTVPAMLAAAIFFAALLATRGLRPAREPAIRNFGVKPTVAPD